MLLATSSGSECPNQHLVVIVIFDSLAKSFGKARPVLVRAFSVKRAGRVGGQIIQHDADALRFGKVDVHEFLHAGGEVDGGAAVGDFDLAPGPMHVKEDEQIGGAIALVLAIVALQLAPAWL